MPRSVWTTDHILLLIAMWEQGYHGSEIAEALGPEFTVMAVLSKAHHIKLPGRTSLASARLRPHLVA